MRTPTPTATPSSSAPSDASTSRLAASRDAAGAAASMPRPSPVPEGARGLASVSRAWDAVRDYARRVWINSSEDDIFFLAGGIAFNILLATVPFVLLVIAGLTYALDLAPDVSFAEVSLLLDRFLPPHREGPDAPVHALLRDVIASRGALGAWSAVTFIWFSTRLFGSLRTVLAEIFDIDTPRGLIAGKWFDVRMTVISTALLVAYAGISTYLALASSRGVTFLVQLGLRESVMGTVEYAVGRLVAFVFIVASFWALYKYLPHRRVRWQQALVGALASSILLEAARNVWSALTESFNQASLYTGTLYALVSLVFWVYYAALIFILGAEVAQAHELRRTRRLQHETLN
jgi:membrane protein